MNSSRKLLSLLVKYTTSSISEYSNFELHFCILLGPEYVVCTLGHAKTRKMKGTKVHNPRAILSLLKFVSSA